MRSTWRAAWPEQKALIVSRRHPGRLVLGGDTCAGLWRRISANAPAWRRHGPLLHKLSAKDPSAGLCRGPGPRWRSAVDACQPLPHDHAQLEPQIPGRLRRAEGPAILSSVGGYHFEGRGAQLFDTVEGDYFSVLGLPLLPVLAELREEGVLEHESDGQSKACRHDRLAGRPIPCRRCCMAIGCRTWH